MALVEEMAEETRNFLDFFDQSRVEEVLIEVKPEITKLARVPKVLRDDERIKECFEPKFVSIGPYHHGNQKLHAAEDFKKKLARSFVSVCRSSARTMYDKLYNDIKQIRDFYENELTDKYNDEALTRILFVDGCFLLYFIHGLSKNAMEKKHIVRVLWDICLLENQLPFLVLKLLGENNFAEWPGLIVSFIEDHCNRSLPTEETWKNYHLQPGNSSHLVQFLQIGFQGSYEVKRDLNYRLGHLISCTVTELMEVGIYCKPSRLGGFKGTRFSPHWFYGVLELPSMVIGLNTRTYLLNLIAYEMHPDVHEFEIQSYIFLLAILIRQPQDVKALREARVLNNYFGSDEEVVELFKEISAKSSLEKGFGLFETIQVEIGGYLDKRGRTKIASWLAEVFKVYFRSPWTTVTVLAGFLVLTAAIIQTVFQIVSYKKNVE